MNIGGMVDAVTGLRWKIAAGAAALVIAAAGIWLLSLQIENRHLGKLNTNLEARINAPGIGYAAKLAQAETNAATLSGTIDTVNAKLRQQEADAAKTVGELTVQIATINRANATLRANSAHIITGKPEGVTLEARVKDVDARVLETLK